MPASAAIPAWLPLAILFAPVLTAGFLLACGRRAGHWGAWLSVAMMAACFAGALAVFLGGLDQGHWLGWHSSTVTWLAAGATSATPGFGLSLGLQLDGMGALMLMIVTGLATLVLLFSTWYLHDDRDYPRFFWMFDFFCFSMLGIVLSDNLLMTFICWELVGLGSYFLIGYWFDKPAVADDAFYQGMKAPYATGIIESKLSPGDAQLKAFVMNRIGDFGFLAGIAITAWVVAGWCAASGHPATHLLSWDTVFAAVADGAFAKASFAGLTGSDLLTLAGVGIFLGAMGKSAQFPLHTWLPDAMQGPTTASSIIHAATMVAAGVFLVARVYPMLTPDALLVVSWIGALTCFIAAVIACTQWDFKGVLAYSTVSQLGYMMLGLGAGALAGGLGAGIGHLFTHALFKCMLFLCAASVIHACAGHQDLGRMGGLARRMPITAGVTLVGVLAICGLPGFSAFWSKDAILASAQVAAQQRGGMAWIPYALGLATAGLTCYYMMRLWVQAFLGPERDHHVTHHAHDPWPRALLALLVLAPFSLQAVWTGSLNPFAAHSWLDHLLAAPSAGLLSMPGALLPSPALTEALHYAHVQVMIAASVLLVLGAGTALVVFWWLPARGIDAAARLRQLPPFSWAWTVSARLWGIEYLYDALFVRGLGKGAGRGLAEVDLGTPERLARLDGGGQRQTEPDPPSLDGAIDAGARLVRWIGSAGNALQSGRINAYVGVVALVTAVLVALVLVG
jgi:NADH-quinone oxidoreductase subunit L